MGYGLVRLPLWVSGVFVAAVWSACMLTLTSARDSVGSVVVVLVGGALVGTVMALAAGRQRRRMFTVDGRELSGRERVAVVRAVYRGEPLPDGDLRTVARRFAERLDAQPRRWWLPGVAVAVMVALNAWLAVSDSPWYWAGVVVWPVVAGAAAVQARTQRTAVDRFLSTT